MRQIAIGACCMFLFSSAAWGVWLGLSFLAATPRPKDILLPDLDRVSTIDLAGHTEALGCAAFSPNGKLVATTCYDRKVRLFDVPKGKMLHTFAFGDDVDNKPDKLGIRTQGLQRAIAFDAEEKKIIAVGGNWLSPPISLATVFDLTSKKEIFTSRAH